MGREVNRPMPTTSRRPSMTESLTVPARPPRATGTFTRVTLTPLQKLTRAHLAAQTRPEALAALQASSSRVAQKAGAMLKTSLLVQGRLLPSTLQPLTHLAARGLYVALDFDGEATGLLELDLLAAGTVLHHLSGAKEQVGPPQRLTPVEEAALGWVLLSALAEARADAALGAFTPRLIAVTLDRAAALAHLEGHRRHLVTQLELQLGDTRAQGRLMVPALWLQAKLNALPEEAPPALLPQVGDARMPVRVRAGRSIIPRSEAAALSRGDTLLIGDLALEHGALRGGARLVGPSFELRGSLVEAGLSIITHPLTEESTMSSNEQSIAVEVEIELQRLRLPLHQLGAIKPGAVVPLHINAAQHVVVRIGDKAVAKAELVDIEGEVGARIVAML